jgi:hypothetical protein
MCMELSQQNPLIFMYANPKIKANFKNTLWKDFKIYPDKSTSSLAFNHILLENFLFESLRHYKF